MRCFDHVRIKSRNSCTFERLWRCKLLHGPCIAVADQDNCGESSVTNFGYDNSYFIATPFAKYKVKIYTLILEVILFKRISYWS